MELVKDSLEKNRKKFNIKRLAINSDSIELLFTKWGEIKGDNHLDEMLLFISRQLNDVGIVSDEKSCSVCCSNQLEIHPFIWGDTGHMICTACDSEIAEEYIKIDDVELSRLVIGGILAFTFSLVGVLIWSYSFVLLGVISTGFVFGIGFLSHYGFTIVNKNVNKVGMNIILSIGLLSSLIGGFVSLLYDLYDYGIKANSLLDYLMIDEESQNRLFWSLIFVLVCYFFFATYYSKNFGKYRTYQSLKTK